LWKLVAAACVGSILFDPAGGAAADYRPVYDLEQNAPRAKPVLEHCADGASTDAGQPVLFSHWGDLSLSVSTRPAPYGEPIPLLLWFENPTDTTIGVWQCTGIANFLYGGFDIFDSAGHRILSRDDHHLKDAGVDSDGFRFSPMCSGQTPIPIPAHSCIHGTFPSILKDAWSSPENLLRADLSRVYDLPPGRYYMVERTRTPTPFDTPNGIAISVEDGRP